MYWQTFKYNFRWSDYIWLMNGWLNKFAFAIPAIGYLILFNDSVVSILNFQQLTGSNLLYSGLHSGARLKLIYFGLIFMGTANMMYFVFRPHVLRLAESETPYVTKAFEIYTVREYININDRINLHGHVTLYGKYYDAEWDFFIKEALGTLGTNEQIGAIIGNWASAKSRHENLLRSMLLDNFFRYDTGRRIKLTITIAISMTGYVLIFIPSLDLFIKVLTVVFLK